MAVPIEAVVDEAIRFERNLAALYMLFSEEIADDSDFWWELSVAEEKHAMLLESSRSLFDEEFSSETVTADLAALRASNDELEDTCERMQSRSPTREQALRLALTLENDANEQTLHRLLEIGQSPRARAVLDRIRNDESLHVRLIVERAQLAGIEL